MSGVEVLVLGSGRCGTRSLYEHLMDNDVPTTWEYPKPGKDSYPLQRVCSQYVHGQRPAKDVVKTLDSFQGAGGLGRVMIHTVLPWAITAVLPRIDPTHVVHLHRDGRDVVRSQLSRWEHTLDSGFSVENRAHRPYHGVDHPVPVFIHACDYWAGATHRIHDLRDEVEYHDVSLTDLEPVGVGLLEDLLDVDLDGDVPRSQSQDEYSFPAPEDWTHPYRAVFEWKAGPMMRGLGYW